MGFACLKLKFNPMIFIKDEPVMLQMPDGGMRYTETDMSRLIPEPLNTLSSSLFILLALYWLIKLLPVYRNHLFLLTCSFILLIGSIGGTLFHGLRKYHFFLVMDYMPIMILCLMTGIYFLIRVIGKWYYGLLILMSYGGCIFFLRSGMHGYNRHFLINVNYAILALMVLVPTILFLIKMKFRGWLMVSLALFTFCIALFFRIADPWKLLSAGTHFLWHICGAFATALMFRFIYLNDSSWQPIQNHFQRVPKILPSCRHVS